MSPGLVQVVADADGGGGGGEQVGQADNGENCATQTTSNESPVLSAVATRCQLNE